ncbi:phospholipid/cholesterol/gamma-HCH transport system substrate-binding protein [Prauserella shujinwangii]|uniref:Phospholipid/cholesterol/gamma-HCH transport system substrate-binding protein n=1 Tax=Prauserella shujinwangii TaxID=1453103 RepID=A0A2T0LPY4_9PSEU|nr:MCE family protein [Prauserella shujinwangii]PRX45416.1 phospholipid/cholesterol/gamma-HCH transport system substrate-binding protein [Prauserella shujinwangii]
MSAPARSRRRGPLVDGALGALVLLVVVAVAVAAPRVSFLASTRAYTAEFANAAGLREGDQVYVAGVPAGRVTAVELAGDRVRVGFRLDGGQPLGERTSAAVKLATVLGTRHLSVRPAGPGELADGATIPLARTAVPYSLGELGADAAATTAELDLPTLRRMIGTLRRSAPDGDLLGSALTGISRATEVVGERGGQFRALLRGVRTLTTSLLDQRETLVALLGDARLVADVLHSRRDTVRTLLTDVNTLTTALDELLRENEPLLDPLLSDLHAVTATLSRTERELSETLRLLGPGSRYLANATGNGPWGDVAGPAGPLPDNLLCVVKLLEGCR